jgi:hypothetical protein
MQEIEEDVTAEQETLIKLSGKDSESDGAQSARSIDAPNFTQLQTTLMEASKGVTEGTDTEYKRYAL